MNAKVRSSTCSAPRACSWTYFPDAYVLPWAWVSAPVFTPGFHTITSPNIPVAIQRVWQALALDTNGQIILSPPAMMDVTN